MFDISFRARAARKTDAGGQADVILVDPERGDQPGIDTLFRRFAVEVFVVGLRVGASMVDDAVPMIWRRIERVEFQGNVTGIEDVVICPSWHDDREARLDRRPNSIETASPLPSSTRKNWSSLWTSAPISSLGFNAMTTSWQLFAV